MTDIQIHEFDPVIYPFRLWVGKFLSEEYLCEKFYGLTEDMERVDLKEMHKSDRFCTASTIIVADKNTGWGGAVVAIHKPSAMDIKTIAHEASHVADFVCEYFGISMDSFDGGEAKAYLVGWVADCINQAKTGKFNN